VEERSPKIEPNVDGEANIDCVTDNHNCSGRIDCLESYVEGDIDAVQEDQNDDEEVPVHAKPTILRYD